MNDFGILSQCPLFEGIEHGEIELMLNCLSGRKTEVLKGAPVFLEGDSADFVGVVLEGAIQIVRDDYYGNRSVMAVAEKGELFAEAFSCAGVEALPVSAFALCDSKVMLLNCRQVLTVCSSACRFHHRLIGNLLKVVARKSLMLTHKIQLMSCRTTREKIMAYLLDQAKRRNVSEFVIPYDRQALADHLGVERSAMSAEIGKLKREGVIDTKGSWFRIM